jgi:hypothetical protein
MAKVEKKVGNIELIKVSMGRDRTPMEGQKKFSEIGKESNSQKIKSSNRKIAPLEASVDGWKK